MKRDVIQAFAITLAGLLSLYLSDFGVLQNRFLLAFEGYLLLLFFIGSVVLQSVRHGFFASFSALLSVSLLSILHILSLPSYDALAPVSYFAVLLFSFLLNLYVLYGRFILNKPLFKVYEDSKFALTVAVIATIGTGLALATQEMMEQFGLLLMVGAAVSYLIMLFYLSALVRLEKTFQEMDELSEDEQRIRNFIHRYGKGKEVHPFYASWLGTAVSSIEGYIDRLESKGHLGHHFFSAHLPFFWFSTLISFFMGIAFGGGSLLRALPAYFLIVLGVMFMAPQTFLTRSSRRLIGACLMIGGLCFLFLQGGFAFKIAAVSALLGLVSIYFAYRDDEFISMFFASFFTGSLFTLGYSLFKPPVLFSPVPWIITAAVFVLNVYEFYMQALRTQTAQA